MDRRKVFDTREALKRELFASARGCEEHFEKNRPCKEGVYGASDQYIILDSFQKLDASAPNAGEFRWNFSVQGATDDQSIGVRDCLDTIIEAHIAEFNIPALLDYPYTPPTSLNTIPNPGPPSFMNISQLLYDNVVTIDMNEIGLQSISDSGGKRHHFELQAYPSVHSDERYQLVPLKRFEIYIFTKPIKDIHGLTLIFRNPDNRISFPQDVYKNVLAYNDGGLLSFTALGNNLNAGDRVYISGFNSVVEPLNRYVNNPNGLVIGTGGLTVGNTFRLDPDVDLTPFPLPPPGSQIPTTGVINVYILKNRIRIPFRFRRVVDELTQYHEIGNFP